MELFEKILSGNTRGKCYTNHFHITLNCDIKEGLEIWEQDQKTLGTFMHEYLHYIQHLITLRGLSSVNAYNKYFLLCFQTFAKSETIDIPLDVLKESPGLKSFDKGFKSIKGINENLDITFSEIEISRANIEKALDENTPVKVDVYDYKEDDAMTFDFGYYCIIESMAHLFQTMIDETATHPNIPYNSVQLICSFIYPEIAEDKKMMISLCLCALISMNPGAYFFEVLEIAKANRNLSGLQLYEYILSKKKILYKGKPIKVSELTNLYLTSLEEDLKILTNSDLPVYHSVIKNCKSEINRDSSVLLDMIYNEDISNPMIIKKLISIYNYPFIEANNLTLLNMIEDNEGIMRVAKDVGRLRGLELLIKRLSPPKDENTKAIIHKCPLFDECKNKLYDETVKEEFKPEMDENCLVKQWLKRGTNCVVGETFYYFRLDGKDYVCH